MRPKKVSSCKRESREAKEEDKSFSFFPLRMKKLIAGVLERGMRDDEAR